MNEPSVAFLRWWFNRREASIAYAAWLRRTQTDEHTERALRGRWAAIEMQRRPDFDEEDWAMVDAFNAYHRSLRDRREGRR